jgi:ParB/RepB/Spo0J family partition protein
MTNFPLSLRSIPRASKFYDPLRWKPPAVTVALKRGRMVRSGNKPKDKEKFMAVIATLKTAEDRHTPDSYSIASIPLNKLVPWDGNVRKTNAEEGLGELVASIAAHGVLQSLVVRKANRGKYSIVAGRRRFLALSALADAGTIAIDSPVPCRIIPGSTDATEISLTENVMRAPMHPADQFEAFRALIDSGSTAEEVAARFGITSAAMKKRLKLARVSPAIFEAYRKGDLSLEQIQAFAISDDHPARENLFENLSEWNRDPEWSEHLHRDLQQSQSACIGR